LIDKLLRTWKDAVDAYVKMKMPAFQETPLLGLAVPGR